MKKELWLLKKNHGYRQGEWGENAAWWRILAKQKYRCWQDVSVSPQNRVCGTNSKLKNVHGCTFFNDAVRGCLVNRWVCCSANVTDCMPFLTKVTKRRNATVSKVQTLFNCCILKNALRRGVLIFYRAPGIFTTMFASSGFFSRSFFKPSARALLT